MKNLKSILLCFFALCFWVSANAQTITFQKTFHYNADDVGMAITTNDSGYAVLLNHNQLQPTSAACLIKFDKYADTVWVNHFSVPNCEMYASELIQTADSGFLFGGTAMGTCVTPIAIKTDANGNFLWIKEVPIIGIQETYDGGYCVGGGNCIKKYDSNLNLQWQYWYGGALDNGVTSVLKQTTDSGYVSLGSTKSFAAGGSNDFDLYLARVDKNGNFLWGKSYGSTQLEGESDIIQTPDGGFLLLGVTYGFGAGGADILIIKTDSAGNIQWNKTYGGTYLDSPGQVIKSGGSLGYVFAGLSNGMESTYYGGIKTFLFKVDLNGNHQWGRMYGDFGQNAVYDEWAPLIQIGYDGGFLLSGFTSAFGQGHTKDVWLIKTDALGFSGCNETTIAPTITNPTLIVSSGGTRHNFSYSFPQASIQVSNASVQNVFLCSSNIPVSVNEEEETITDLKLYPNPSTGIFTLQRATDATAQVIVYDMLGNAVLQTTLQNQTSALDLSSQAKGIYYLQLKEGDKMYWQKAVIQ